MKKLLLALTLVAVFAAASFAGVQDFGKFTIDVPEGWTATQDGETVGIVKNDNSAALSISVDSKAVLSGDDSNYALFVVTGAENAPDDISAMMDSLTEK